MITQLVLWRTFYDDCQPFAVIDTDGNIIPDGVLRLMRGEEPNEETEEIVAWIRSEHPNASFHEKHSDSPPPHIAHTLQTQVYPFESPDGYNTLMVAFVEFTECNPAILTRLRYSLPILPPKEVYEG